MQALGNDFVVIDTLNTPFLPNPKLICYLSDRHFGIGFDQLLLISKSKQLEDVYDYQIFNADGSEVGQCGNGARCVAQFIHRYIAPDQKKFRLKTKTTILSLEIMDNEFVKLILPCPSFKPEDIPLISNTKDSYLINDVQFHALSVGNPHAVIIVDSLDAFNHMDISQIGREIENNPMFPERCNVNFVFIQDRNNIRLRVWERGCGETKACGSGALASAAVVRKFYQLNPHIQVQLKGGGLSVHWPDTQGPIEQIGPAVEVFQGHFRLANT